MNQPFNQSASNVIPLRGLTPLVSPDIPVSHLERTFDGPMSGPMWKKVQSLNSKYADDFDWSIYDKLEARFGENQPRGGVVFNTTFKLVNHLASCTRCHYSFEIDCYGRGCTFNCLYCYAKEQLFARKYWNEPIPFPVNLADVRKTFHTVFETSRKSKWRAILEQRIPLRIGSMSDSFMWMDRKYGVAKELLKILKFYEYPYIVFTRSDLLAEDEYLSLLSPELCSIQFSISGGNEKLTKLLEPGAPTVARRLKALKVLADAGIWTTVRINPLFPIYPDGYYSDPFYVKRRFGSMDKVPKFDFFSWEFIEQLSEAKVPSLLAGFVRLSPWAMKNIAAATGVNIKDFFRPEMFVRSEDRKYTDSEIAFYYKKIQSLSQKKGIRFNTCYIGNGIKDYFKYQSLWTNKSDCCDALSNVSGFKATSQEIGWDERINHASCKQSAQESMRIDLKGETFSDVTRTVESTPDERPPETVQPP
jgi:DNA repair photolyase